MKIVRTKATYHTPSAKTLALYQPKKAAVLEHLRAAYSAGWVARFLELPETLVIFWRKDAGIAPLKPGYGRRMGGHGQND